MAWWSRLGGKPACQHVAVPDYSRWENAASGAGFFVSKCKNCGVEMTRYPVADWKVGRPSPSKK